MKALPLRSTLLALLAAVCVPALAAEPRPAAAKAEPTDAEVGDAASFGRSVNWLGLASGVVDLAADCSPATPTDPPRPNCVTLNPAPAITTFDRPDLDSITLPARSTRSLLCHWQTPNANILWRNTTAASSTARLSIRPYYRIESEVLADPTLINPQTGLPFGGSLEVGLTAVNESQTLAAGDSMSRFYGNTRACVAGTLSRDFLVRTFGLSEEQARQFFRRPITIRLGLRGTAQLVEGAIINIGTRYVGD